MGVCVYFSNIALNLVLSQTISTVISILIGAIVYVLAVLILRILSEEDILMIPYGTKIYSILKKLKIYKEPKTNA